MVDHDIVWLDIPEEQQITLSGASVKSQTCDNSPVHDPHAVAIVQSLEELVQVAPDVVVCESLVKLLEVSVVDMLEDEGRGARDRILDHALQCDYICPTPGRRKKGK